MRRQKVGTECESVTLNPKLDHIYENRERERKSEREKKESEWDGEKETSKE